MKAVILAGGKGARLAPYTKILPKPLMPIGDMPILEIILRQMQRAGITEATLTVGHMAKLFRLFFQSGEQIGLPIRYSYEEEPLGTAGPLALMSLGLGEACIFILFGPLLTWGVGYVLSGEFWAVAWWLGLPQANDASVALLAVVVGAAWPWLEVAGERFDWARVTGKLLRIASQRDEPAGAFVKVRYRGHWFYIADDDLDSKSTFSMLTLVLALVVMVAVIVGANVGGVLGAFVAAPFVATLRELARDDAGGDVS